MATSNQQAAQCPECAGRLVTDGTEHCQDCGLVVDDAPINARPDWTENADGPDNPSRGVTDPTFAGKNMGSEIAYDDSISDRQRAFHRRAKTSSKRERCQAYLTGEIRRIVSALDLPDSLQEQAAQLMTTLYSETDDLSGKDLDTLAAAGALVVARVRERGVTAADVVEVARDVERNTLLSRRKWLCNTLGLSVPPPTPEARLGVVASELGVSEATRRQARQMLDGFDDMDRQRAKPSSIVATVLWRVSARRYTQMQCADAAGVTATTIRLADSKLPDADQATLEQF